MEKLGGKSRRKPPDLSRRLRIYEADFMGFSYGFRPKRGQHQALDAIHEGITKKKVNYIFDADIRDFFNKINREWLIKFIEHRIADKMVIGSSRNV